jgi:polar amino acid transport system substrate-binding protein
MVGAVLGLSDVAQSRSLDAIRGSGMLGLCAHPTALRQQGGYPSRISDRVGQRARVWLRLDRIITQYQMRSAGCDMCST